MVQSCSTWILWLTRCYFVFTSGLIFNNVIDVRWAWVLPVSCFFDLESLEFCFPPLQCMLPTRKALKLLSAKSLCWLLSLVAMLILVNNLCEVCVSLGFSYFLATDLLRQYTGLKAKVMAAFPERAEIKENMQSIKDFSLQNRGFG